MRRGVSWRSRRAWPVRVMMRVVRRDGICGQKAVSLPCHGESLEVRPCGQNSAYCAALRPHPQPLFFASLQRRDARQSGGHKQRTTRARRRRVATMLSAYIRFVTCCMHTIYTYSTHQTQYAAWTQSVLCACWHLWPDAHVPMYSSRVPRVPYAYMCIGMYICIVRVISCRTAAAQSSVG